MLGIGLAVVVAAGAVPASAQEVDDASPSVKPTQIPVTTESGRPDLYLDMPNYIDGFEPDIVMTRGEEHWTGPILLEDLEDPTTGVDRIGGRDVTVAD